MLEVIGWFTIVAFELGMTVFCAGCWFNMMGKYNIGGVPNTTKDRVFVVLFTAAVVLGWFKVFSISPFILSIR